MPAALSYAPEDTALRDEAEQELAARRAGCAEAWDYYEGRHRKQLKVKSGKVDDNVVINQWKQGKDREITFLFPAKMIGFELDESEEMDSPDETWLREAWQRNKGKKALRRLAKYGAMTGHVFARVMPSETAGGYPRIIALNPANVVVFWQADDYEKVLWYEIYWSAGKLERRQDIVHEEGGWRILDYEREKKDATAYDQKAKPWRLVGETTWEFELGPIVDWQHIDRPGQYYGDNEASLIPLQDKVNKVASDTGKILRYYASPKTVIQSDTEPKALENGIDDAWLLPRESEVKNIEMKSDLASSVAFGQMLIDAMKAQQRVVVLTGSAADFQRVTNLGVQTVFIDQLAKNDELWEQYEPGLVDLCKLMLCVAGKMWDRMIKITRSSPLPTDPKEVMDVQEKELDQGLVSKETIMRERGRNPQQERKLIEQEGSSNDNAIIRALAREGNPTPLPPTPQAVRGNQQQPMPPMPPAQNGRPQ